MWTKVLNNILPLPGLVSPEMLYCPVFKKAVHIPRIMESVTVIEQAGPLKHKAPGWVSQASCFPGTIMEWHTHGTLCSPWLLTSSPPCVLPPMPYALSQESPSPASLLDLEVPVSSAVCRVECSDSQPACIFHSCAAQHFPGPWGWGLGTGI